MNKVTIDLNKLTHGEKMFVEAILKKVENSFGIPEHEHTYYYINTVSGIVAELWMGDSIDKEKYLLGNYFLTRRDAQFELEKRKIIRKLEILSKKAGGVDWEDENQRKFRMQYSHYSKVLSCKGNFILQDPGQIYFPSEQSIQQAIDIVGEERIKKYLFGVKE